jgi:hypothetical protein
VSHISFLALSRPHFGLPGKQISKATTFFRKCHNLDFGHIRASGWPRESHEAARLASAIKKKRDIMYQSTKIFSIAGACVALLTGVAAHAETAWKPPLEIQKANEAAATPVATEVAAPVAPAPAAAAPASAQSKADKEKSCNEQASAKGLKGKAKKQFKAECLKS